MSAATKLKVIKLLGQGLGAKVIAERLGVSESAVWAVGRALKRNDALSQALGQ